MPEHGYVIPSADAAGTTRVREWGMGCHGQQSQSALLRHHRSRTAPTGEAEGGMGSHRFNHAGGTSGTKLILEGSMGTLREWLSRLWGTFRRTSHDREIEEDIRCESQLAAEDR